jgi:hypothetical protein
MGNKIVVTPPLNVPEAHLSTTVEILDAAFSLLQQKPGLP